LNIPKKLLLSDLLNHHVRCNQGIDHGLGVFAWMHPPVHRLLGWITRTSSFSLEREVWRLDQIKAINQQEVYVKGASSNSDQKTLDRFPTLMNAKVFNDKGKKIGLIADFFFETKSGKILFYLISRSNPSLPGTSRWRLSVDQIIDKQPGFVSCDFHSLEDLPIYKASLREELLNKSRKWKTQFQDLTYKASDRLEGWIDEQIIEDSEEDQYSSFQSEDNSYDDWIDNSNIDTSQGFNRMNETQKNKKVTNERDLDPWI
tara:strand:- start:1432 stop:2208 length:777 start_codon:yes stop_codon:yes gene_type:complete